MNEIKSVFRALPVELRVRGMMLVSLMIFGALLEFIGLASVAPFLAFVGSPENLERYAALAALYDFFGKPDRLAFACYLALMTFIAVLVSASFRIFLLHLINSYVQRVAVYLGHTLFSGYLASDYSFFLAKNSSELTHTIVTHVTNAVAHALHPVLVIVTNLIVLVVLFGGLMLVDPLASAVISLFVLAVYGILYLASHAAVRRMGHTAVREETRKHRICTEALSGVKIVKSRGLEKFYSRRFLDSANIYARAQAVSQSIAPSARYFVEALGIGGVLLFSLYVLKDSTNVGTALSVIGIYVMAANRLLPSVQQIYQGFSQIRYGMPALQAVLQDINFDHSINVSPEAFEFKSIESIELRDLSYTYPGSDRQILRNISATLPGKKVIGVVGASGAGKTTLIDIMLGLLRPQNGGIFVNEVEVDLMRLPSWKQLIGYVPQETFLVDGTIAENIAYGVESQSINYARLHEVAISAGIHKLITSWEKGYGTEVGDRGVRLSGGQRQRIAIARALYSDPQVLIFDEATSALDVATEQEVIESILALSGQLTVIMITHRLQSIQKADLIIHIENGQIIGRGSFGELLKESEKFRQLSFAP